MHCALTRSADSGFFVAFGEAGALGRWSHCLGRFPPKAPQAPEADRVIAGYVQIHSVLTAGSDKFA
jgi:hypothetical protein